MTAPLPAAEDVPPPDRPNTVAHLAYGTGTEIGHVQRHIAQAQEAGTAEGVKFNLAHGSAHAEGARDHVTRLLSALAAFYPEVGAELDRLREVSEPGSEPPAEPVSREYAKAREETRAAYAAGSVWEDQS